MPNPPHGSPPGSASHVHVADEVLAKIAAYRTIQVPGVAGLRPTLVQTVAARRPRPSRDKDKPQITTDGVRVDAKSEPVTVELDVVLFYGQSCLDLAAAIQQTVADSLTLDAGVTPVVTVNIVDLEIGPDAGPGSTEQP